jgi:predicted amidohydrolase YtcJ
MNRILLLFLELCLCLLLLACRPGEEVVSDPVEGEAQETQKARLLVLNARIHTFNPENIVLESAAMAVAGDGTILALGDSLTMSSAFPLTRRVDMEGKTVLPGLIDAHGHLYGLAESYTRANLVGTRSKAEVMNRLREFEKCLQKGEWLLGRGWDQNYWPEAVFPGKQELDAEFPDRPVWLRRIDGHAAWGNSAAMAQADKDFSGDWQPQGGFIHRDEHGEATGVFVDGAMELVDSLVPVTSPETIEAALDLATRSLVSLGLTAVHDPGVNRSVVELYLKKIRQNKFPLRVYAMTDGVGETLDWLCAEGIVDEPSGKLQMRSVKLYADGALGSRGAALLEDYSDDSGNRGLLFVSQSLLEEQIRRAMSCGLQVGIHAIGDGGNRQVLDAYERVLAEFPDNPGRHRIEHAQILHPDDIPRFSQLGVIAAMQPTHATSDMYWAVDRLGEHRARGAYAWRSLLDNGALLAFGSDFPVEQVNPMLGIHAAVTRQDLQGWPADGWFPEQSISREQAIRAFTLDAAYAAFMENETGSLEVGKRAAYIVLDRDIMQVPADQIPDIQVLQTWLDGELVFTRN